MERVPNGRNVKEFREEAVKMAKDDGVSALEISKRLSLPKSTIAKQVALGCTKYNPIFCLDYGKSLI